MCFEVSLQCECLDEGGLADAVVAAQKHLGHVQRHSARVQEAKQVALLIVDGAGGGGENSEVGHKGKHKPGSEKT